MLPVHLFGTHWPENGWTPVATKSIYRLIEEISQVFDEELYILAL